MPDRSKNRYIAEVKVYLGTRGISKNLRKKFSVIMHAPLLFRPPSLLFESRSPHETVKNRDRVAPRIRVVRDSSATVSSGKEKKKKNLTSSTDRLSTLGMFRSSKHSAVVSLRDVAKFNYRIFYALGTREMFRYVILRISSLKKKKKKDRRLSIFYLSLILRYRLSSKRVK